MQYVKLGDSNLQVSRVCLGCMSYGDPSRGEELWSLDEQASRPLLKRALDAGVTFFDTAASYSGGSSEEIVGRALIDFARRNEIVLATKMFCSIRPSPPEAASTRQAITMGIDASLRRLGTDYVDLYQIDRFDPRTPH
jgi:aryl-alcohol dehydrogenase-like predicted oxidoreductase